MYRELSISRRLDAAIEHAQRLVEESQRLCQDSSRLAESATRARRTCRELVPAGRCA